MKRIGLLVLAVVMTVGAAGCSEPQLDYHFNGTWAVTKVVVQSTASAAPVGQTETASVTIVQDGTSFILVAADGRRDSGSCDPLAGSFVVSVAENGAGYVLTGQTVDQDTMSGDLTVYGVDFAIRSTLTFSRTGG